MNSGGLEQPKQSDLQEVLLLPPKEDEKMLMESMVPSVNRKVSHEEILKGNLTRGAQPQND